MIYQLNDSLVILFNFIWKFKYKILNKETIRLEILKIVFIPHLNLQ